eukprot:TRINITY_DN108874_c0_g1_i1.p1 TRINITY_DN108874_c0_g1~~TRINITY_DN108874_c0_g1_i1.p1  ORF type:complete len:154 (-),score=12.94 TRINITY_DN108874_c0_g1_i1:187-648(-)
MNLKETYEAACERYKCKRNSAMIKMLEEAPDSLQVLNYNNNYCGSENGFNAILEVIKANDLLTGVDLSGNFLSTENIKALVEVLIKHPSVISVKLNNNRLYIDAGKELVRLARHNRRLQEIEVDAQGYKNNNKIPVKIMGQLNRELMMNRERK